MISRPLTIVMYHYVRPLAETRFPRIKGLDLRLFREQLGYLRRHYSIVSGEQVIAAFQDGGRAWDLPSNAALLTFDDGYSDHYQYVFPILEEADIPACFFPPATAILDRCVLEVNRIHFILAAASDSRLIIEGIWASMDRYRSEFKLKSNEQYYGELAHASRFDSAEIVFIKRMLQMALPAELRERISRELFARHVTADERSFAEEVYVTLDQLRCMRRHGMYVGSHGSAHNWLGKLAADDQARDVDRSVQMLRQLGSDTRRWIMCYPYGDSNESLRDILSARGCALGLTTVVGIASGASDPFLLPRLDTNDLPLDANADPNEWTTQVRA